MSVCNGNKNDLSADPFVTIVKSDGHSGHGFYVWLTEYPDEGAAFFDHMPTLEDLDACGMGPSL